MEDRKPNIVLVITDNQAADLLGCYGNTEMHSPHLDRMAQEGMRFDQAFCPNAMCSPCRASIFTGRMPGQHGVHTWIDDRQKPNWPENWNAVGEFETFTEILKREGYATALVGKYHLGIPGNGSNGIDYWVTMEKGHTLDFHGNLMNVNGETFVHEGHSVEYFTEQAVQYVEARASERDQPFALIIAYNGPYGHWPSIKGEADNRFYDLYRDCDMHSVPREGVSKEAIDLYDLQKDMGGKGGPDFSATLQIPNNLTSLRNYYSQMSLIDDGVGQVLKALDDTGQDEDTITIFTADHGFSLGHHGFWGHGQATWPSNAHRIAYNIPLIVRGRGMDAAVNEGMVSSLDLYSTIIELAGGSVDDETIPSRSLVPIMGGTEMQREQVHFIEQEETRAIRTPDWLYVERFSGCASFDLGNQLFDLQVDPDERINVAGSIEHAEQERTLKERLYAYFERYNDLRYDLWSGGQVKSNTSRPWLWKEMWGETWGPIY